VLVSCGTWNFVRGHGTFCEAFLGDIPRGKGGEQSLKLTTRKRSHPACFFGEAGEAFESQECVGLMVQHTTFFTSHNIL
jgi:hypothetical protein